MDFRRWSAWLLAGLLVLQGWNLARLNRQLNQLQARFTSIESYYNSRLSGLEAEVRNRVPLPAWLGRPDIKTVADPECREHRALVTWSLTDWTPGTAVRLQFRRGTGEDWQEAQVRDQGAQSYLATIPLTGGPGLLWRVTIGKAAATPGMSGPARTVYWPPETEQFRSGSMMAAPAFQYRIVADTPGGSRATEPQVLGLGSDLIAQASFHVAAGAGREYSVDAGGWNTGRCTQVRSVVARAFAGGTQIGEYPMSRHTGTSGEIMKAQWKSDTDLTRIDMIVQYGIHEDVIPVDL